jgi:hypothetical protein
VIVAKSVAPKAPAAADGDGAGGANGGSPPGGEPS